MNVITVCIIYASLVCAGFLTPSPEKHNSKDDVVSTPKEGVVIELERDDGNTKVSISPQDSPGKGYVANAKEKLEEANERLREASSSVLPDVAKTGDSRSQEEGIRRGFTPGEVVCDAYGECKDKFGSYMGRTKEAAEKLYEAEEVAEDAVREGIDKVRDAVAHTAHKTKESVKDAAGEFSTKAKDKVAEKVSEMKEGAKEMVREKAKAAEEMVRSAQDRAKHEADKAKDDGKKGVLRQGGGVFARLVPPVRMAPLTGVLHLLGFASAYGMCVWVTFASNYVLAGAMPRHQFAMVQSKIYPVYFRAMACSVGMASLGHIVGQTKRFFPLGTGTFRGFNLMASLVMILVNLLYLEPRATKVVLERMKKEKEEGRGKEGEPTGTAADTGTTGGETTRPGEKQEEPASKPENGRSNETRLRKLNSYSSLLNVATLMSLSWHLVQLGQHLHAAC